MAHLVINNEYIIITSGNKIAAFATKNPKNDRFLEFPAISTTQQKKDTATKTSQKEVKCVEEDFGILCLKLCRCSKHLAACNDQKQLCVWSIENDFQLLCTRNLPRKALSMAFLGDCEWILVADKTGDVYRFEVRPGSSSEEEKLLLGHLSTVLDLVLCPQDKFVITCDRDEKIRVSCYPNCYNINSFCLGHSEFVIKLGILPTHPDILVSGSGDGTLRFWKFQTGKEIGIVHCAEHIPDSLLDHSKANQDKSIRFCTTNKPLADNNNREKKLAIKNLACSENNIIAVLYHNISITGIFQAEFSETNDAISCNFLQNIILPSESWDVGFDCQNLLWVVCSSMIEPVHVYSFEANMFAPPNEKQIALVALVGRITENASFFQDSANVPSLIPTLYKQWFDNVTQFLVSNEERKKQKNVKPTSKTSAPCTNKKQRIV